MAESSRRIPVPQAQAFVACRKITNDPQTGEIVIVGPVSRWRAGLAGREPLPPWEWRKEHQHRKEAVKQ
jgi:hypothetical protein